MHVLKLSIIKNLKILMKPYITQSILRKQSTGVPQKILLIENSKGMLEKIQKVC